MMRVVLFCFLPFWVQAQAMQPGVYRDLKPTEPIVLDTGSYTFIGLVFKSPFGGFRGLLDARKARSLTLIGCTFEGTGSGTAVLSSGDLLVSECHFENMGTAILQQSPAGKVRKVSIVSNVFKNNLISIHLKKHPENEIFLSMKYGPIPGQRPSNLLSVRRALRNSPDRGGNAGTSNWLDLKCNTFIHTLSDPVNTTPNRKGLVIASGAKVGSYDPNSTNNVSENKIGGNNTMNSGSPYPSANVWPTLTTRTTLPQTLPSGLEGDVHDLPPIGWEDAPKWISIENNTTTTVQYYRYINEFVQGIGTATQYLAFPQGPKKMATQGNFDDPNFDPSNFEFACDNPTDPWPVLFPARIAVISSNAKSEQNKNPMMLDPVPNPAQNESRIPLVLQPSAELVLVQILEMTTGKVLQNVPIGQRGELDCFLDVSHAPSGLYAIRLMVDGKPAGFKKLAVIK